MWSGALGVTRERPRTPTLALLVAGEVRGKGRGGMPRAHKARVVTSETLGWSLPGGVTLSGDCSNSHHCPDVTILVCRVVCAPETTFQLLGLSFSETFVSLIPPPSKVHFPSFLGWVYPLDRGVIFLGHFLAISC